MVESVGPESMKMIEEVREEVKEEKKEKKNPFASLFKKKEKTPQNSDPLIETATEETVSPIILENSSENSETDQKNKKNRKEKEPRPKGKTVTFVFAILTCIVLFIGICGVIGAFIFANKLCEDKPTLDVADLVAPDSSTIYDNEGNKIMELGLYLRENIEYEEMPNCLIDAFLAIEDSRFFEHFGFEKIRCHKADTEEDSCQHEGNAHLLVCFHFYLVFYVVCQAHACFYEVVRHSDL